MRHNAYVTTGADHRLTAGSTVVVLDGRGEQIVSAPVPVSAGDLGGVMFWPRVGVALGTVGWRPTGINPGRPEPGFTQEEPGIVRFDAKRKES